MTALVAKCSGNLTFCLAQCHQLTETESLHRSSLVLQCDIVDRLELFHAHKATYGTRACGHLDQVKDAISDILRIGLGAR
jgi:hypothetical protein